jgi:plastocyanin
MRHRHLLLLVIAAVLAVGATSNAVAATVIVTMTSGLTFQPRSIIINSGDTVTWQNPAGGVTHSVVADDGSFSSPDVLGGQSFSLVFTTVGTVPYHCGHHGAAGGVGMSGTIFVGNRTQHAANEHSLELSAWDFTTQQHTLNGATDEQWGLAFGTPFSRYLISGGNLYAGVSLPNGVEITDVEIVGCDSDPSNDLSLRLWRLPEPAGSPLLVAQANSSGTPGCGFFSSPLVSEFVDNLGSSYLLEILANNSAPPLEFRTVRVFYKTSISYPPANPTFSDVPATHPFFRFVEALAKSGVTGGCGGGNYCPDAPITRGQMAVFLAGALGLFWPN